MIRDIKHKLTKACTLSLILAAGFALGHLNARHEIMLKQAHAASPQCDSLIDRTYCMYDEKEPDGSAGKAIFIYLKKEVQVHAVKQKFTGEVAIYLK
jgi:hypothetical protein